MENLPIIRADPQIAQKPITLSTFAFSCRMEAEEGYGLPRPPKWRRVEYLPPCAYFKPAGVPLRQLAEEHLAVEELEAIRLKDLEGLEQEECAARMQVSRPTFQRILTTARSKVARALVEGKAIRVEGGYFVLAGRHLICRVCGHEWDEARAVAPGERRHCPRCASPEVQHHAGHRRGRGWGREK